MPSGEIQYIVQVTVEREIQPDWLGWMQSEHVPAVLGTGCFSSADIFRVADPPAADRSDAYVIVYRAKSPADLQRYLRDFAPALRKEVVDRYGSRFTANRLVLERVWTAPEGQIRAATGG
ncbi:MAG: DUF4286 family protein [Phycisphaerae bacterium]|nr:DUF4286 family protein [Phycisphaerae bacterium]MDW8262446.1 DUF4286 family protein [Phycisphaerales bacterium]